MLPLIIKAKVKVFNLKFKGFNAFNHLFVFPCKCKCCFYLFTYFKHSVTLYCTLHVFFFYFVNDLVYFNC